jgi:hypothetical protein
MTGITKMFIRLGDAHVLVPERGFEPGPFFFQVDGGEWDL